MSKHTPGPWHIGTSLERHRANIWSQTEAVTSVPYGSDTERANADLIAAAPELLAALERIMQRAPSCACAECEQAHAAIRKAKGKA